LDLFGADVTLQLLDFVIEDEFEFFELLNFLLELANLDVLLLYGRDTCSELFLTS
jgi:hypothetical protein